jgi:ABC-type multidrug transport system ATPase subunit
VEYLLGDGSIVPPERVSGRVSVVLEEVELPPIRVYDILEAYIGGGGIDRAVEEFGLEDVVDKRYSELSSGFKKRVQLAIGFSRNPDVIFIDEPFTNIDPYFVPRLRDLLKDAARDRVVVIISHQDLGYVPDKVVLLNEGRVVYEGRGPEVYRGRVRLLVRTASGTVESSVDEINSMLERIGCGARIEGVEVVGIVENLARRGVYTKK